MNFPSKDKKQKIMKAVETLFASRNIHEITTDDIAGEAKVGKGTIYRYFHDKEDLFFQTATSGFDELSDLIFRNVPDNISFAEQLICTCKEIRAFFTNRRHLLSIMNTEEGRMFWCKKSVSKRWGEKRKQLVSMVAGIIEKGVQEGVLRADISSDILAYILLSMLRTQAKEFSEYPPSIHQPELIVDLFINGIKKEDEI